ncbi:MAG: arylsulfotransferase family protein [bacterium]
MIPKRAPTPSRRPRAARPLGLVLAAALLAPWSAAAATADPAPSAPPEAEIERLRSLGYAGFDSASASSSGDGVVLHDAARSYPGYDLYTNPRLCSAVLIDAAGHERHRWSAKRCGKWFHATLLDSGVLVVPATDSAAGETADDDLASRHLLALGWSGEVLWDRPLAVHHDVAPTPSGELVTLLVANRAAGDIDAGTPLRDNLVARLTAQGEVVDRHSLYAALRGAGVLELGGVAKRRAGAIDLLHANAVQWLADGPDLGQPAPARHRPHVLVTIRHQDLVALLRWDTGEIVWSWGRGELMGPHDATLLPSGHVLVFDNGLGRGWSRVVELDPRARRIVWEYRSDPPDRFFTLSRGSSQRLPNGNTLIAESDRGHAFEVTASGERVWEFWNPARNERGERSSIVRMRRIEPALVDRLLGRPAPLGAAPAP